MRRFSQRNSLVTLNEINITPLLDLAFVLLIIFVITRPLLEQSVDMHLPDVGKVSAPKKLNPQDIRVVEILASGEIRLGGKKMGLDSVEKSLKETFTQNKNLVVNIRADRASSCDNFVQVINICIKNGITRVAPQTAPEK